MTIEEKRRELFEAWAEGRGLDLYCSKTGIYEETETLWAWSAWRAALDAVVIELPETIGVYFHPESDREQAFDPDDVRAAIESTGLGLKVLP